MILLGETIPQVFAQMTANPAHEIKQDQLGNLSVGSIADVAVFSEEHGTFGFFDMFGAKAMGHTKLQCELTIKGGKIVYDLNAMEFDLWNAPKHSSNPALAGHWTMFNIRPYGPQESAKWPLWIPPSQRNTKETGVPDVYNMKKPSESTGTPVH